MIPNYRKILLIVLSSFAIGIIYNFISPNGIPLIRNEAEIVYDYGEEFNSGSSEESSTEIRALTTEQVYAIFTNNEAKFVDSRDSWDFADGHIPGSINIPEYKFTPEDSKLKLLDKNDKIIVYCEGDQCEVSKRLAGELQKLGYKKIWVYLGGYKEWWDNKFPVEKE